MKDDLGSPVSRRRPQKAEAGWSWKCRLSISSSRETSTISLTEISLPVWCKSTVFNHSILYVQGYVLCWELVLHFLLAWILARFLKLMIKDVKYFKHPLHHPAPQAATAPYLSKFAPLISTRSCGCNRKSTPRCSCPGNQMGFHGNQLPITDAVKGNLKERNLSVRINSKTNKNITKRERKWFKKKSVFYQVRQNFRIFAGWALTGTLEALPHFLLMETECKLI